MLKIYIPPGIIYGYIRITAIPTFTYVLHFIYNMLRCFFQLLRTFFKNYINRSIRTMHDTEYRVQILLSGQAKDNRSFRKSKKRKIESRKMMPSRDCETNFYIQRAGKYKSTIVHRYHADIIIAIPSRMPYITYFYTWYNGERRSSTYHITHSLNVFWFWSNLQQYLIYIIRVRCIVYSYSFLLILIAIFQYFQY